MIKKIVIGLGIMSVLVFAVYYQYAFSHFPLVNQNYADAVNYTIYLALAFSFFELGNNQEKKLQILVYYSIAEFWLFLTVTYILNDIFDVKVIMHKVICAIFLTFLSSLLWYFWKL